MGKIVTINNNSKKKPRKPIIKYPSIPPVWPRCVSLLLHHEPTPPLFSHLTGGPLLGECGQFFRVLKFTKCIHHGGPGPPLSQMWFPNTNAPPIPLQMRVRERARMSRWPARTGCRFRSLSHLFGQLNVGLIPFGQMHPRCKRIQGVVEWENKNS